MCGCVDTNAWWHTSKSPFIIWVGKIHIADHLLLPAVQFHLLISIHVGPCWNILWKMVKFLKARGLRSIWDSGLWPKIMLVCFWNGNSRWKFHRHYLISVSEYNHIVWQDFQKEMKVIRMNSLSAETSIVIVLTLFEGTTTTMMN